MRINLISNINFAARKVQYDDAKVKKRVDGSWRYRDYDVSVAEIDLDSKSDIDVLDNVKNSWTRGRFIDYIYRDAKKLYKKEWGRRDSYKIYVLTTQKDNFERLEPGDILSICEMSDIKDKSAYLSYIETCPEYRDARSPEYKGVGSCLMKFLQSKYDVLTLNTVENPKTTEFYLKFGFLIEDPYEGYLRWEKKIN